MGLPGGRKRHRRSVVLSIYHVTAFGQRSRYAYHDAHSRGLHLDRRGDAGFDSYRGAGAAGDASVIVENVDRKCLLEGIHPDFS